MKNWMDKKNEHKARVQQRWDNRGIMKEAFQKWKTLITHEQMDESGGERTSRGNREYGGDAPNKILGSGQNNTEITNTG
eukprot:6178580-Pleurochrysis_carterae.AAC.2